MNLPIILSIIDSNFEIPNIIQLDFVIDKKQPDNIKPVLPSIATLIFIVILSFDNEINLLQ